MLEFIRDQKHKAWLIGEVVKGKGEARVVSCLMAGNVAEACKAFARTVELEPQRDVNKKLLAFAKEVESGRRPCPKTEAEILRAI